MINAQTHIKNKIRYIQGIIPFIVVILIGRLWYLQIMHGQHFSEQGTKNFLRIEHTLPTRGNIIDCKGRLLATNRPTIDISWHGSGNYKLTSDQVAMLETLDRIIGSSLSTDRQQLRAITIAERFHKRHPLAFDITFEQLSQIEEYIGNHNNLRFQTGFKRLYPHNDCACHIIGYLRTVNGKPVGQMGLEKLFDDLLTGQTGSLQHIINSFGRHIHTTQLKETLAGKTLQTTLDLDIQIIAERVFGPHHCGAFLVMESATGALRAVVSRPGFDPNIFIDAIDSDTWSSLQINRPFINRAFDCAYPPGSIFKLITVTAALEEELIVQDSTWQCNGFFHFAGRNYRCHNHHGHGLLTTKEALAKSCNILFFHIGKQLSIDTLAHYAHQFGYGTKTGIIFKEHAGLIPTTAWKYKTYKSPWWPGESLSAAIGQSYLLATLAQVARAVNAIFTHQLITPRILIDEPIKTTLLDTKPQTHSFLKKSMKYVVTKGTGRHASIKDITLYAKTSTAQTSALEKRELGNEFLEHGWFVVYVAYKNHPPLTFVILVERAGSSSVATDIARNFLIEYKKLMDQQV